ncbi:hypothetical protein JTE90_023785 [Oedothorax gibbosus]|uniref:Uncharacterized protein n=1 Tax=Oedothorax gibbosus TaxID=931172 RepID=A0AAV6URS5_9ARAC|nr:hypothetical protein JTE90_023785 [Oedothorax gibbosus]
MEGKMLLARPPPLPPMDDKIAWKENVPKKKRTKNRMSPALSEQCIIPPHTKSSPFSQQQRKPQAASKDPGITKRKEAQDESRLGPHGNRSRIDDVLLPCHISFA